MAYVKLIHDDRSQNSFTCFQPFVKALENVTCKGTYGTLPRHDEYSVSWIGWCHLDAYLHKSSSNYTLNLCTSLYGTYNGKIKDKTSYRNKYSK